MTKEKILVTSALPYANGPLHIGHLAGAYLPADVYVRFKRLQGHNVHFVCGSDEHGAAITFKAMAEKTTPQAIVDKYHEILKRDLINCGIEFDIFSRTSHPLHVKRSQEFFLNALKNGYIEKHSEKRLHCDKCQRFLPDRYVVGECPSCHAAGARGDQCEKCGTWYEPEALINPICQLCKENKAGLKDTAHWYLCLDKLEKPLRAWLETKTWWRKSVLGYAYQPLKAELTSRSITRDLDWGIPVPLDEAKDKVLYVWFDAPIGYVSASEDWGIQNGQPEAWKEWWEDKDTKLVHFIGKDNIIFHTVVWPAIIMADGRCVLPHLVAGNEFLNLEGEKISTSRNFAIWASDAVATVGVDPLRYYMTRISPENSDSNFTWSDFQARVNGELADVIGNLVNRCLSFVNKNYEGQVCPAGAKLDVNIESRCAETVKAYTDSIDLGLTKTALEHAVELARFLNGFMQEKAPWKVRKEDPLAAHQLLYSLCRGIKTLALLIYPVCPGIGESIWKQLGHSTSLLSSSLEERNGDFPQGQKLNTTIEPIVHKVEDELIQAEKEKLLQILANAGK
jgi:methionyl-tRNA synthetase